MIKILVDVDVLDELLAFVPFGDGLEAKLDELRAEIARARATK